jgi:hypothetical protein
LSTEDDAELALCRSALSTLISAEETDYAANGTYVTLAVLQESRDSNHLPYLDSDFCARLDMAGYELFFGGPAPEAQYWQASILRSGGRGILMSTDETGFIRWLNQARDGE